MEAQVAPSCIAMEAKNNSVSQRKIASQMPRGTRLDPSGSFLEVKGARNYSAHQLSITADEMYDDIVQRGLRADGLSTKLGVKNSRESIAKLVSSLFQNDSRRDEVIQNYNTKRQRSNCAKTVFATMTNDELKIIREELIPARVDAHLKNCLTSVFDNEINKLENAVQVLQKIQEIFSQCLPDCEILSAHNFQTRGFFLDVFLLINDFIMQILGDVYGQEQHEDFRASNNLQQSVEVTNSQNDVVGDQTVAEILLSVGLTPPPVAPGQRPRKNRPSKIKPKVTEEDSKEWVTVGIVDQTGQTKYLLVKTPKDIEGTIEADKLLELINNPDTVILDSTGEEKSFIVDQAEHRNHANEGHGNVNEPTVKIVTSQSCIAAADNGTGMTTLEITLPTISKSPAKRVLSEVQGSSGKRRKS